MICDLPLGACDLVFSPNMPLTRFPGFVDVHAHLREPGAEYKEDFATGTRAALKGGFTFVCDMPNNPLPTVSRERLEEKISLADAKALCNVGFHYGTDGTNIDTFAMAIAHPRVFGLKLYCNATTGALLVDERAIEKIVASWETEKPLLVHAEGERLPFVLELAKHYKRTLHVCHVARACEVELIRRAKEQRNGISAGVCPHHLFLTGSDRDRLRGYAIMQPPLGDKRDQEALWEGLQDYTLDVVETDHAPHTREEKEKDPPPFGVPGLETAAGLLFRAVIDKRIEEKDVARLLHDNPKRIFHIPDQPDTFIELDTDKPFIVGEDGYETKCGWSPFEAWILYGKVEKIVFKGNIVLEQGRILKKISNSK